MIEQIETKLTDGFKSSMKQLLQDEYPAYIASFQEPSFTGIRVNTSRITVEEFLKLCPFSLTPIPWTKNGFYVRKEDPVTKHPFYYAGLYYVQEPSAMVPASRLPVGPGDVVLDLCAAPGGKATELGSRLQDSGLLVANDISNSRAKALLKNLELFGIGNLCVCSEAPEKLAAIYPSYFTRILIDAPCSGEGMFRKDPSMLKSYAEHGPEYYAAIQKTILSRAYEMLQTDGMILYSTCTFSPLENECVIADFLSAHPDMELLNMEDCDGFVHGKTPDGYHETDHLDRCIRLFPHRIHGEGHFAALLHKKGTFENAVSLKNTLTPLKKLPEEWEAFQKNYLNYSFDRYHFYQVKEQLYAFPDAYDIPKQVRFLRTGLLLGDCRKNRFEPSQALAMYLKKHQAAQVLDLTAEDPRVLRYLKGETLDLTESENSLQGWILVCICGHPLGWGKAHQGSLKNKYYSGWRILS